jgi:predicted secreted protein
MADVKLWTQQLADQRSRKVTFLSHCLLKENTRYLGVACRGGAIRELVEACLDNGLGIVQIPCPEQQTWWCWTTCPVTNRQQLSRRLNR